MGDINPHKSPKIHGLLNDLQVIYMIIIASLEIENFSDICNRNSTDWVKKLVSC